MHQHKNSVVSHDIVVIDDLSEDGFDHIPRTPDSGQELITRPTVNHVPRKFRDRKLSQQAFRRPAPKLQPYLPADDDDIQPEGFVPLTSGKCMSPRKICLFVSGIIILTAVTVGTAFAFTQRNSPSGRPNLWKFFHNISSKQFFLF